MKPTGTGDGAEDLAHLAYRVAGVADDRAVGHEHDDVRRLEQRAAAVRELRLSGHGHDLTTDLPSFEQASGVLEPVEEQRPLAGLGGRGERARQTR